LIFEVDQVAIGKQSQEVHVAVGPGEVVDGTATGKLVQAHWWRNDLFLEGRDQNALTVSDGDRGIVIGHVWCTKVRSCSELVFDIQSGACKQVQALSKKNRKSLSNLISL